MRCFKEESKKKDKKINQLSVEINQLKEKLDQVGGELVQVKKENKQLKAKQNSQKKSRGTSSYASRSYNVRNFKGYPQVKRPKSKRTSPQYRTMPAVNDRRVADQTTCPHCSMTLSPPTEIYERRTEDLINSRWLVTKWEIVRRYCKYCNKQITPEIDGVLRGEHFGVNIMMMVLSLRCINTPFEKIKSVLEMFYGVHIATSTLNHFCDVINEEFESLYTKLTERLRRTGRVQGDETGWFVNGKNWWVWVFVGRNATIYVMDKSRSKAIPIEVLGKFAGIIGSDSYGAWNYVGKRHQKCLLHYFREMYRTKEKNDSKEFARFFRTLYRILKDAINYKKGKKLSAQDKEQIVKRLEQRVHHLINKKYVDEDCLRYVKRLKREVNSLFTFIVCNIDYHNNSSERAARKFADARKIMFGSRSKKGAKRSAVMMSIYETCRMRGVNFYDFGRDYLTGKINDIPKKHAAHAAAASTTAAAI